MSISAGVVPLAKLSGFNWKSESINEFSSSTSNVLKPNILA